MFFNSEEDIALKEIEDELKEGCSFNYQKIITEDYSSDYVCPSYNLLKWSPLFSAVQSNFPKVVKRLLREENINVNLGYLEERGGSSMEFKKEISPLAEACRKGYEDIVEMLLNHPLIDLTPSSWYLSAALEGRDRMLRSSRQSFIQIANGNGYKGIIKLLQEAYLKRYKTPDMVTIRLWTPKILGGKDVGHVSIETSNNYMSFCPRERHPHIPKSEKYVGRRTPCFNTYQEDVSGEGEGRSEEKVMYLFSLDAKAMDDEFEILKTKVKNWVLPGNNILYDQTEGSVHNCASFATQLLEAGLKQNPSNWTLIPRNPAGFFSWIESLEATDLRSIENRLYPRKEEAKKEAPPYCVIC